MLVLLVSGIASAQDGAQISITELESTFGPATRIALINYTEDVCPDSERSLNSNTYRVTVPQVSFTWVGEAGTVGENARLFTELDHPNSAYDGVQYRFQGGTGGFNTPGILACGIPPHFTEIHAAYGLCCSGRMEKRNEYRWGSVVLTFNPDTNQYTTNISHVPGPFNSQADVIYALE